MTEKGFTIVTTAEEKPFINMLIYGQAGVGKTVFASTAPSPLFITIDTGTFSIRDKKIPKINITDYSEFKAIMDSLIKGELKEYETIVIDTLGNLQKKHMEYVLKQHNREKAQMQDWQINIETIRKIARILRNLSVNVILICHEMIEKDEDLGSIVKIRPTMNGKRLPDEIVGYCDIAGYMIARETKGESQVKGVAKETNMSYISDIVRMIRVQPNEKLPVKDHSGKLGVWIEPDFTVIQKKVFGEIKKIKKEENKQKTNQKQRPEKGTKGGEK